MELSDEQKRLLVLAYYRAGWKPSHAALDAYCRGVRITRRDYLDILRAYVREHDPARKLGRRRAP